MSDNITMLRKAAEIGWDQAVAAIQNENGSQSEVILNVNPYRTEHQMSDKRELKEARELLVIRADHAGRLADEVRELEAERDGLLAKIERVRASAQDGLENSDYDFGLSSFWVLDALSTTPAQSLANLQSALVLEYIDSPEHAESLSEQKHKVFQSIRDASEFERGDISTGLLDALWIDVDKFNALEDQEDVDWVRFTATEYAESLRVAAEKAWVEARSHSDAFYDPALDEAINPYRKTTESETNHE